MKVESESPACGTRWASLRISDALTQRRMFQVMTCCILIRARNRQELSFAERAREERHTERIARGVKARHDVHGRVRRQVRERRVTTGGRSTSEAATASAAAWRWGS